ANDFEDARIQANVFRRAAAGDDKGVVVFGPDLVEGSVESEIVAALLGVGLIAFEIVNGGGDEVAGFLTGTDGIDDMADHQKRLEGDHNFVVFNVVADDHEN